MGNVNKLRAIVSWLRWFSVERLHWIMAVVASAAFADSLLTPPTIENPTSDAGLVAPVIALCTAAIVFAQAMNPRGLRIQRTPGIFIGVGSMASAYLWMAAEAETHPTDPASSERRVSSSVLAAWPAPTYGWQRKLKPTQPIRHCRLHY